MGNRCPDCNKFVGLETQEPEIQDSDIAQDGTITLEVRVVRCCADCGTEMKETIFSGDVEPTDEITEHLELRELGGDEPHTLSVDEPYLEYSEEMNTIDRHGKPIKSARYMATLIGYSGTFTVSCSCGDTFEVEVSESTQAGSFDDLT